MEITKGKIKITKVSNMKIRDKRTGEVYLSTNYEIDARFPGQKTAEELEYLGYECMGWEEIDNRTVDLDLALLFAAGKENN